MTIGLTSHSKLCRHRWPAPPSRVAAHPHCPCREGTSFYWIGFYI